MENKVPNPGSPEAVEQGCLCPVMDNHNGVGRPLGGAENAFWINYACPIHGGEKK
jgi:hypothetical protein